MLCFYIARWRTLNMHWVLDIKPLNRLNRHNDQTGIGGMCVGRYMAVCMV